MLGQSWLIIKTCTKLLKTRKKETHLNLNLIFLFFSTFSLLGRVTLSRSSFIQTNIFSKKNSFSFSIILNMVYFFQQLLFQTEHHHHIFFINFRLTLKNIFFEENEYDTHFLNFLFNIPKYIFWRKWTRHSLSIFFKFFYCKQNIILFFLQRNKIKNFIFFCIFWIQKFK